ncbi:hypothetical protein [Paenibacillus monticola]|uniref:ABC transporter permease n=1 Tax=Paenibacillus monticola TaxID=2666075 RepID=A0A7X2L3P1_9BACL|nr:hypothetical protein [Paenibacillus monticola]MRN55478.1 hypothetical protein [Paenibacillus monticola]
MKTIKDAWFMIQGDFRGDKLRVLWTFLFSILFMGYLALLTGMVVDDVLDSNGQTGSLLVDFLLVSLIPMLGFTFSRRTMKYWSEDPYTKTLAYFRSMPIPSAVILCKRKFQAVLAFVLNGGLFFVLMYILSSHLRIELSLSSYLSFALSWVGLGLVLTGVYISMELLVSGRAYFWLTILIVLLSMGSTFLIWLAGGNLFLYSISYSQEWGLLSPIMWGMLLLGMISVQLFSKWTIHRLKSRDLI